MFSITLLHTKVNDTERYITGALLSPFFKSGVMLEDFHSSGTLPLLIEA